MWKFRLPEEREFAGAITMKVCGHGLPDGMPAGLLGPYQQGSARHTASVAVAALDTTRLRRRTPPDLVGKVPFRRNTTMIRGIPADCPLGLVTVARSAALLFLSVRKVVDQQPHAQLPRIPVETIQKM